ncbi:MAG: class I SAM-dependent methyltransferase [Promethearchaeota archaeon]
MGSHHENSKQSNIDFRLMSVFFRIRDKIHKPRIEVEKAGINKGDTVLDYGCGPGSYTIEAAKMAGASGRVYAIDIHPLAIKKVNKKAEKLGLKNIETLRTDCDTGLQGDSIDKILLFDVLHDLTEPNSVLKELWRVLKSGGILIVNDHHLSKEQLIARFTENNLFKLKERKNSQYQFIKS